MKPARTIPEQIALLKSRNLIFEDEIKAAQFLSRNNYYRLSGYWRKYQIDPDKGENNFVDNTIFEKVATIYELDALLRNLLQKGMGIFEICFRSKFAYYMAHSEPDGQLLYLRQNSYNNKISEKENPKDLLDKINMEIERSKEKFATHYKERKEDIPIWVAIEILSFGTVSRMYSRWINKNVIKKVSAEFNFFKSYDSSIHTIRSLVNLRNFCAHQARIWNRGLMAQVTDRRYLRKIEPVNERSQWRVICTLMVLVDEINQNKNYSTRVMRLCKKNEEFYKGLIEPTL
jgi:abortive infection bacteriophage resistance protein